MMPSHGHGFRSAAAAAAQGRWRGGGEGSPRPRRRPRPRRAAHGAPRRGAAAAVRGEAVARPDAPGPLPAPGPRAERAGPAASPGTRARGAGRGQAPRDGTGRGGRRGRRGAAPCPRRGSWPRVPPPRAPRVPRESAGAAGRQLGAVARASAGDPRLKLAEDVSGCPWGSGDRPGAPLAAVSAPWTSGNSAEFLGRTFPEQCLQLGQVSRTPGDSGCAVWPRPAGAPRPGAHGSVESGLKSP